jgi:hypothetical protein
MNKQRMRIPSASARLEWRTIAVTAKDPLAFAKDLQSALQELTDGGFIITGQMQLTDALIITASRVLAPTPEAHSELPQRTPLRRRVVEFHTARAQGAGTEEVLYHYVDHVDGQQKQKPFPTLVDALRQVKEHLRTDTVLPVNITTVSMTRFEPPAFPMLLKMFAEDLQCPPG